MIRMLSSMDDCLAYITVTIMSQTTTVWLCIKSSRLRCVTKYVRVRMTQPGKSIGVIPVVKKDDVADPTIKGTVGVGQDAKQFLGIYN